MAKPHVRIFGAMSTTTLYRLRQHFVVSYHPTGVPDLSARSDAMAIVTRGHIVVDDDFMKAHPNAKLVIRAGSGMEKVNSAALERRNVTLVRLGSERSARSVAELCLLSALFLLREAGRGHIGLTRGVWRKPDLIGRELYGKRVGVWGFGPVGRSAAQIFAALGCEIRVHNRSGATDPFPHAPQLESLCAWGDIQVVALPLTSRTRGIVSAQLLQLMAQAQAILINAARWEVLDVPVAMDLLASGLLRGLAIDPIDLEHVPAAADRLGREDVNLLLTPHIGASTLEAMDRMGEAIADHLERYLLDP